MNPAKPTRISSKQDSSTRPLVTDKMLMLALPPVLVDCRTDTKVGETAQCPAFRFTDYQSDFRWHHTEQEIIIMKRLVIRMF